MSRFTFILFHCNTMTLNKLTCLLNDQSLRQALSANSINQVTDGRFLLAVTTLSLHIGRAVSYCHFLSVRLLIHTEFMRCCSSSASTLLVKLYMYTVFHKNVAVGPTFVIITLEKLVWFCTARRNVRIANAVLATAIPSVRPSVRLSACLPVCPSVTRRYYVKTTARSTVQFKCI